MFYSVLVVSALCIGNVAAKPTSVVHERRSDIQQQEWKQGARMPSNTILRMAIGLTQSNLDKGHDMLMDMSDPSKPTYGQHMSAEDVTNFFAPRDETVKSVTEWLVGAGIDYERLRLSPNKQWIKFGASATEAESLFHAKYHEYQHKKTLERSVATEQYAVPHHLQQHIDYITPGIRLRSMQRTRIATKSSLPCLDKLVPRATSHPYANCTTCGMTPECIAAIYGITKATTAVHGNEIGFYESDDDIFYQKDFNLYVAKFYPRIPQNFTPTFIGIDNASTVYNRKHYGDEETSLDTQVAMPIIYPQGFTIWEVALDKKTIDVEYNTWLDAIDGSYCNYTAFNITGDSPTVDPVYPNNQYPKPEQCGVYKRTNVISASWGIAEAAYPVNYIKRQCNEFMKLGMQGTSIFFCSQDYGVEGGAGIPGNIQKTHDCLGKKRNIFAPIYPASCPYITAVGATKFPKGSNVLNQSLETAAEFSGGGFSNVFPAPEYQKSAIHTYLTDHPPHHPSYSTENGQNIGQGGGIFNRNGRGAPDVSALGTDFIGYSDGSVNGGSGTSMSTPLWAAVVTRINEQRLLAKKPTLGFINPALYQKPELVRDILTGHNVGCGYKGVGFNVTKGWDPVTGLGSPDFPALMKYFMSL